MKKIISFCLLISLAACSPSSSTPATGTGSPATGPVFTVTTPNAPASFNVNNLTNPSMTLQRGQTYTFNVSATGHPFFISTSTGTNTANAYNTGVTNNNIQSGTVTFVVPAAAPNTLYYNCANHTSMGGVINITN